MPRRKFVLLLLVPLLGLGAWIVARRTIFREKTSTYGEFVVRVSARLVQAGTGQPLGSAFVLTVPIRSWASDAGTIGMYRQWIVEARGRPDLVAGANTDSEGRFSALVCVPWCFSTVNGVAQGPVRPPARSGVQALWIERRAGAAPAIVDVAGGTWQEHAPSRELWAVGADWDLGEVVVPAEP